MGKADSMLFVDAHNAFFNISRQAEAIGVMMKDIVLRYDLAA